MSNNYKRGGPKSTSLPINDRGDTSLSTGSRPASSRGRPGKTRQLDRVWGKPPNATHDQKGLTFLFSEQNRLKNRLLAQSRLARLDVTEVRSTEAEQLRRVNQAILDVSSGVEGFSNPFRQRNLTDAQILSEDMIRRQGVRELTQVNPVSVRSPPSPRFIKSRRKWAQGSERPPVLVHQKDWFNLSGPLARYYRRSVERGYLGSPESWIRGPRAAKLITKLSSQGFTLAYPDVRDVHDSRSSLRWALNRCSFQPALDIHRGFSGERLNSKATNVVVLRRQAASVDRLKLSDWPLVPGTKDQSWPTYPTLGESWTMARRGKLPPHHIDPVALGLLSAHKIPTRRVLPGVSARTVSNLVVGVRADVEVPRKFLGYFKYRWGFLILKRCKRFLPKGLVKHLADVWKRDMFRMFLKYPIRYNDALRRIPASRYYRLTGFVRAEDAGRSSKNRRRKGKHERLRDNIAKMIAGQEIPEPRSPSSDKSDGGARLC